MIIDRIKEQLTLNCTSFYGVKRAIADGNFYEPFES